MLVLVDGKTSSVQEPPPLALGGSEVLFRNNFVVFMSVFTYSGLRRTERDGGGTVDGAAPIHRRSRENSYAPQSLAGLYLNNFRSNLCVELSGQERGAEFTPSPFTLLTPLTRLASSLPFLVLFFVILKYGIPLRQLAPSPLPPRPSPPLPRPGPVLLRLCRPCQALPLQLPGRCPGHLRAQPKVH